MHANPADGRLPGELRRKDTLCPHMESFPATRHGRSETDVGTQLGLSGSFVYSIAQVPVSTPGNALSYGLEMNVGASYRNTAEGFYAGMTWGVLWPMGALNRPDTLWTVGQGAGNATAAQVLRGFLGVKF